MKVFKNRIATLYSLTGHFLDQCCSKQKNSLLQKKQYAFQNQGIEKLKKQINNYSIISLDVFDTALMRSVESSSDIHRIIEIEFQRKMKADTFPFVQFRNEAEISARKKAGAKQRVDDLFYEEARIEEIYEEFCRLSQKNWDIEKCIHIEIDTEKKLIYRNPFIYEIYKYCLSQGKRLIYISDMYLSRITIEEILEKNGYSDPVVYCSSDIRLTKHSGKLYDYVLKKEKIKASELLHIGDNIHADIDMAANKGIQAFHLEKKIFRRSIYDRSIKPRRKNINLNDQIITGLARKFNLEQNSDLENRHQLLKQIGYELVGPLHVLFVFWLIDISVKKKIDKLFFLSRDGYYLLKVFEKIKKVFPSLNISGSYLYSSRRLYYLPSIRAMNTTNLELLSETQQKMKVKDLLSRIGMNPHHYSKELKQHSFDDPDAYISDDNGKYMNPDDKKRIQDFFQQTGNEILKKASIERTRLLDYLISSGVNSKKAAIIDVGWNASSAKYLNTLLEEEGPEFPAAYYFGTWSQVASLIDKGYDIYSFFLELAHPLIRRNIIKGSIAVWELFFTAPHASIIGLTEEKNRIEAVFEKAERTDAEKIIIKNIFDASMQFVDDFLSMPGINFETSLHYLEAVSRKVIKDPDYLQAKYLGAFRHRISFGSVSTMNYLAEEPRTFSPQEKKKLMAEASWKSGVKAMYKKKPR
jgi:predicted HAD superfamily hydrolase